MKKDAKTSAKPGLVKRNVANLKKKKPSKPSAPAVEGVSTPVLTPDQEVQVPRAREIDRVALARRLCVPQDGPGSAPVYVSAHDIPKEERGKLYEGGALCPEMRSLESLLEMRARNPRVFENSQMGFSSQLKGNIYQRDWFGRFSRPELEAARFVAIILAADVAFTVEDTSDYTVLGAFGITREGWIYFFARVKGRWTAPGVEDQVKEFYYKNGLMMAVAHQCEHVFVFEDVGGGKVALQHLQSSTTIPILAIRNPFQKIGPDKTQSAKAQLANAIGAPLARTGRVLLPDWEDWTHDQIDEMCEFPMGKHDDAPDMYQLAMLKLCESQAEIISNLLAGQGAGRVVVESAHEAGHPKGLPEPKPEEEVFDCAFTLIEYGDDGIPEIGY